MNVASSQLPAPQIAPRTKVVLQSRQFSSSSSPDTPRTKVVLESRQFSSSSSPDTPRTKVVLQSRQFSSSSSPDTPRTKVVLESRQFSSSSSPDTPRTKVVLQSRQFSSSSSPDTPRTKVVLESRQCLHFARSTRTISAEGCARTGQIALSPAFRSLDTHDLRRGLRTDRTNRALACISRTRRARSPQRVARAWDKSHSRLHFAHSTRTISAEGCAGKGQIALSPAFRALDTHDLRRGLRAHRTNRTRLHFARSTRTISAESCAGIDQIALSPAFRALDTHDLRRGFDKSHSRLHFAHSLDTHDLRRGLRGHGTNRTLACISPLDTHDLRRGLRADRTNRTLACISRTRHARSPQRVARSPDKSHSRVHFAHSTRTISAEGCIFG